MKNCPDIRMNLAPYLARTLDPVATAEIAAHLAACPACRRELEDERELAAGLAPLGRLRAPAALAGRIQSACAVEENRRRRRGAFLRGAALGLAAMLAILVLAPALRPVGTGAPQPAGQVQPAFTPAQIAAARHDLAWTLTLTDRIMADSSRQVLYGIFDRTLPDAVSRSLRQTLATNPKGNS